ncbi:alpha/beta-hydrolase [Nadsonia fulvescens var. elongata DSM 6958]|uniref:Carboxylic ester hydrolase n=1 Tax=Nadsonia fulvescens var. elongata DSM 6958 TaxID=857566 RepID=A0A1E3PRB1_9ASCO|nr:alpha/beta-hydrolase [Nadsonia fulvescens var. elongata DSM 6958]
MNLNLKYLLPLILFVCKAFALEDGDLDWCDAEEEGASLSTCKVSTTSGLLMGVCNSDINKWLGIPYAEPPIGNLRLKDPVIYQSSQNATADTLPPYCAQSDQSNVSEDCLYLNVYAPPSSTSKSSLPVMFFVHGGSFLTGGSADPVFDGSKLASEYEIIVVTYNYRLGILGFYNDGLSTNFAIKDSILALEWVKKNIANFGGDNQKVTVVGHSAGATMVKALMSTAKAKGLFARGILQSDIATYGFYPESLSKELYNKVNTQLGCSSLECVKGKSLTDIINAQNAVCNAIVSTSSVKFNRGICFSPNIDNEILLKDFNVAVLDGSLPNPVDLIAGFVKDEASVSVALSYSHTPALIDYNSFASMLVGAKYQAEISQNKLFTTLINEQGLKDFVRLQMSFTGTRYLWDSPLQYIASAAKANSLFNTYHYQMINGIQHPHNVNIDMCNIANAVCHEDDLYVLFGTYGSSVSSDKINLSSEVRSRWSSFIKSGSPNSGTYQSWGTVNSQDDLNSLVLDGQSSGKIMSTIFYSQNTYLGKDIPYSWQNYFQ